MPDYFVGTYSSKPRDSRTPDTRSTVLNVPLVWNTHARARDQQGKARIMYDVFEAAVGALPDLADVIEYGGAVIPRDSRIIDAEFEHTVIAGLTDANLELVGVDTGAVTILLDAMDLSAAGPKKRLLEEIFDVVTTEDTFVRLSIVAYAGGPMTATDKTQPMITYLTE